MHVLHCAEVKSAPTMIGRLSVNRLTSLNPNHWINSLRVRASSYRVLQEWVLHNSTARSAWPSTSCKKANVIQNVHMHLCFSRHMGSSIIHNPLPDPLPPLTKKAPGEIPDYSLIHILHCSHLIIEHQSANFNRFTGWSVGRCSRVYEGRVRCQDRNTTILDRIETKAKPLVSRVLH